MLEMKVTVTIPDLVDALNKFTEALNNTTAPVKNPIPTTVPTAQSETTTIPTPAPPTMPTINPATESAQVTPQPVPTAAPTYTLDAIAKAGATLVDAGKMEALCSLLAKYGIAAITALDPSQYGAFATELRALGARI